ncbi:unnamed protein product [Heligmosomoides polygyrus]|uniref:SRR1 domain-containing protein n=1 Tax=Heligmosomoides polygyrus TaxID=6339 RepID=A0A183G3S3_HELPZ|nr:unnamed protein product [Heligmosomoides polygyrus]
METMGQTAKAKTTVQYQDENQLLSGSVDIESINPRVLLAYAEKRLRNESRKAISAGHSVTLDEDVQIPVLNNTPEPIIFHEKDTVGEWRNEAWGHLERDMSALGMFFKCLGRRREAGVDYEFACTVNDMVFKDVVPDADETVGELKLDNAYALARLISIFECERNADRKRLRMRDPSYAFITLSGIEKAFTFYKRYCDYVFRCLALNDGSPIMLPHGGNSEIPIEQLNDLNTQGVKLAISHNWRDVEVKEAMQKILILLLEGFRAASSANETLELRTYQRFSEIPELVDHVEPRNIVFVGSTSRNRIHRAKVVVVAPPRGEDSWKVNRLDARDMVELAKMSAMSMRHNIVCMIPLVESTLELFQTAGLHPRQSWEDAYPRIVIKDFLDSLKEYVRGEISIPEDICAEERNTEKRIAKKPREPHECRTVLEQQPHCVMPNPTVMVVTEDVGVAVAEEAEVGEVIN